MQVRIRLYAGTVWAKRRLFISGSAPARTTHGKETQGEIDLTTAFRPIHCRASNQVPNDAVDETGYSSSGASLEDVKH